MITLADLESRNCSPVLTAEETAQVLRKGINQTREAMRTGEIPAVRIGRSYRCPVPALLAWLGQQETRAAPLQE